MRTGLSYMGHHNPKHLKTDLEDIQALGCSDVLVALQENDFVYMNGKLDFLPQLARESGLKPIAIFWGVLNLFGRGRSSQFLLAYPEGHQVNRDGSWNPAGCYNNERNVEHICRMVDRAAAGGYEGYFIDEPTPLECCCPSCRALFEEWFGGNLSEAKDVKRQDFRRRCVVHYVQRITSYIRAEHPRLETQCCVMPVDQSLWSEIGAIPGLDSLGTDIYWVNEDRDVEEMRPLMRELEGLCRREGKMHHQWLQCWAVRKGREDRIREQGRVLVDEKPDALYVWAYLGQIGTSEACADPQSAWAKAAEVLRAAAEV